MFALEQAEAAHAASESLAAFTRYMWTLLEPETPYQHNWHIDAMADHLQAVSTGDIRDLVINVPPRNMKSIMASVMWPAWTWVKRPESRWIFGSYSHNFALRDAGKMRDVVKSERFKKAFKPEWTFLPDQDQKTKFENTLRGFRFTTSITGALTGEGGDFLVADDPHNALDAESEVSRDEVIRWWTTAMSTRGNNPKKTARVIIMQRLHENDLCGHVLKEGGYTELILPAEYRKKSRPMGIGWRDPRTEEGQLLWPERFGREEIDKLKRDLGSKGASSQLQQDPLPSEGGMFKRQWWRFYKELPKKIDMIVQFWDTASKVGVSNDFSVCATWAKTDLGFMCLDVWKGRVEFPELEQQLNFQFNKHKASAVLIEDKSSGQSLIQTARRKFRHIPVLPYDPGQRDKIVRASAATPTCEAGNLWLPEGAPWVNDFIESHERFPLAEHDDEVDTTSMMVDHFSKLQNFQPRIRVL